MNSSEIPTPERNQIRLKELRGSTASTIELPSPQSHLPQHPCPHTYIPGISWNPKEHHLKITAL